MKYLLIVICSILLVFDHKGFAATNVIAEYSTKSQTEKHPTNNLKLNIEELVTKSKHIDYQGPKLTATPSNRLNDLPRKKGALNYFCYSLSIENLSLNEGELYILYSRNVMKKITIVKEFFVDKNLELLENSPQRNKFTGWIATFCGVVSGEPSDLVLMKKDGSKGAVCHIVPKPIEHIISNKKVSAELVAQDGSMYVVKGTGFDPMEEISLHSISEGELLESTFIADDNGRFEMMMMPMVVGKQSGISRETFTNIKNERFRIGLLWGAEKLSTTRFE